MRVLYSMIGAVWQNLVDAFTGMLALIPQFLYFIYTCCASLMDLMQFVIRKLAGLDVYYVDGQAVSGDIVTDFIYGIFGINTGDRYSSLTTVFWSMFIFGCILLVLTTIISIIKAHYNYDAKKSHPFAIIASSVKSFFLMAMVPVMCIFGVYLSNILLQAVDSATSYASDIQLDAVFKNSNENYKDVFKKGTTRTGEEAYTSYDFFNFGAYTNSTSFSGIMFKISARNCNRVRYGAYTASSSTTTGTGSFLWSDFGIFTSKTESSADKKEEVAEMIDFAFANCLKLKDESINNASLLGKESASLISSFTYFESAVWYCGCVNVKCFSKYNVGLVWYYYNLWAFNFFIAYVGIICCLAIFGSVFFGMIVRMIKLMCYFLIYPTIIGIAPLDGGSGFGKWKKEFISDTIMGYGAVVGLNLSYLLLNEFQKIYFFRYDILNEIMSMILLIAVLSVIKDIIKVVSSSIGGADANETGKEAKDAAKKMASEGAEKAMKAANLALKIAAKFNPAAKAISEGLKKAQQLKKKFLEKKGGVVGKDALAKAALANANSEKKQMEEEEAKSKLATEAFSKEIDGADGLSDKAADAKMDAFGTKMGNNDPNSENSAGNIYKRYRSQKREAFAKINADTSLTTAQKTAKMQEVEKELKEEAVNYFALNNENQIKATEHRENYLNYMDENQTLQKEYDAGIKTAKEKNPFVQSVVDLGGATIKLVGEITCFNSGWKKLDKDTGLVDEFKTFGQTLSDVDGSNIPSKLKTKKNKEDEEKEKTNRYRAAISQAQTTSERKFKEIQGLLFMMKKWGTERKDAKERAENVYVDNMNNKPFSSVAKLEGDITSEIDTQIADIKSKGFAQESEMLENRKKEQISKVEAIRKRTMDIAKEEKAGAGSVADKRARATTRIDAEINNYMAQGKITEAQILKQRKGVAIASIK